ncbi:MAG: hypothetical protein OEW67_06920 [Cyclobacteriaceae bacterium]|nr:hypothetical protein [Cyclobacteriaceae bacterium]
MEDRPSKTELIKLLINDRNHHFSHPHEVSLKFWYSIGGTITTLVVALLFKNNNFENIKCFITNNICCLAPLFTVILIGYAIIFWGLSEHTSLHTHQRIRLEEAIQYLLVTKPEDFNYDKFISKYSLLKLKFNKKHKSNSATFLLVAEPDTRTWIKYHDRKIELGIMLILLGIVGIMIVLLIT